MKSVNVHNAKTNFSKLLAAVEDSSESFVICRNGERWRTWCRTKRVTGLKFIPPGQNQDWLRSG